MLLQPQMVTGHVYPAWRSLAIDPIIGRQPDLPPQVVPAYLPLNVGGLFSKKARVPSWKSSVFSSMDAA